ncbi:MAG: tellurite resistance TerB family protein [Leptolyngbyaceae cyanobacterium bins.302]|nr:tellurite resistance TerB family protein [Leptolyngbyaceae cyanobacterium bins.302]
MGLFDKVFGTQTKAQEMFSPAEAYAAITLAAIASDGYLADEEVEGFIASLNRMQLFKSYSGDVMRRMIDKLFGILKREGPGALFGAAKTSLPHEMAASVFAVATDLILADGVVTEEEQSFLNQLYAELDIPEDVALKIVEVMMLKNRA